jgi:SAM-dependent methyltransferase
MYSDVFCRVYNEFGWNYYPEAFGEQLLKWLEAEKLHPASALDLACGTGILCGILHDQGMDVQGMDLSAGMIAIARENRPGVLFDVADMVTYRPGRRFDLVTCTGDAVNHIPDLSDVARIFRNVYECLNAGGYFVFDLLNENEVSDSEPFEMDFSESTRVWFQMTRPGDKQVNLKIRVFENGEPAFEENIQETLHAPERITAMLRDCGFSVLRCADTLLDGENHGTTWFLIARKDG